MADVRRGTGPDAGDGAVAGDGAASTPRVTIGMPVWNVEATVREALDSVLAQDFTDFELIIADNGSTDGTPAILAEYAQKDSRIRVIRHPENLGGAANFSCLPPMARAPYFKWQSGDDIIKPSYLSRTVEVLDAHPDVVLAYPKTVMIDESGEFWRNHEDRLHLPQEQAWRRLHDFARYRWLCNAIHGLIRTQALLDTTMLTPKVSADVTLLAQLALRGKFHEVPERLFLRRIAANSCGLGDMSVDEVAKWFDPQRAAPRISPGLRVWWDIQKAIVVAPLSPGAKAAALVAYDGARARREIGILRYKRRLKKRGEAFPTWDSLREQPTPATGSPPAAS